MGGIDPWFALKVRTRAEPSAYRLLAAKGYECLLPIHLQRRPYSDRTKLVPVALFPGYVFSRFGYAEILPIVTTPIVQYIVSRGGRPEPIPESEIDNIKQLLLSGRAARPWQYLTSGQKVRILRGPLAGLQGGFLRASGAEHLVLSVDLLQRSIAGTLDGAIVVPCRPS